jgi:hypothetical protein
MRLILVRPLVAANRDMNVLLELSQALMTGSTVIDRQQLRVVEHLNQTTANRAAEIAGPTFDRSQLDPLEYCMASGANSIALPHGALLKAHEVCSKA